MLQFILTLIKAFFNPKTAPNSIVSSNTLQSTVIVPDAPKIETKWHVPIREDKFKLTQTFLNPDPETYKITGHHPGVDYGTNGDTDVHAYAVCDGEIIDRGENHKSFGNFIFLYVPSVDRTFAYFHFRYSPPALGQCKSGDILGTVGQTGLSYGIHLHLECLKGRITSADRGRLFTSFENLQKYAEDANKFIVDRL